ncbi:GTP-binding protein, partial [Candidatus Bathyarchaeota archaeon]|nr:GTP-binding protein [Candidatus Bathyarchaeota archaeon]
MGSQQKMVHCGLFGHVDSGKTAISSVLSEIISTAGLDAHPQSKKRGISIDIGFTSFDLDGYQVTLVDAPGHADLIRSVVASASIIDVAILVIDATKGPEIQTGEHMVILEALGINKILVALNKVDLLEPKGLDAMVDRLQSFLTRAGDHFRDAPIIPISAKNKEGIDGLLDHLLNLIKSSQLERNLQDPFLMPFDHHFRAKGFGTVITGTVISGKACVGEVMEISPLGMEGKIKSINVFKESREQVQAGDRAGIAIAGINNEKLYRGCVLCKPGSMEQAKHVLMDGFLIPLFKQQLSFKSQVHVTVGMLTVAGTMYPYDIREGKKLALDALPPGTLDKSKARRFKAYIQLFEPVPVREGFQVLISRLDLPPTRLRIAARGLIEEISEGVP